MRDMDVDEYMWKEVAPWFVLAFIGLGLLGYFGHKNWCQNWEANIDALV